MAYKPYEQDWWPLPRVVQHLLELGADVMQARADICAALSDRKIYIRGKIAQTDRYVPGRPFSMARNEVDVPKHLHPNDFDWENSRPLKPWATGNGQLDFDHGVRLIGELELLREEVVGVFGEARESLVTNSTNERLGAIPDAAPSRPLRKRGRPPGDDEQRAREIRALLKIAGTEYPKRGKSFRAMAEHLRSLQRVCETRFKGRSTIEQILRGVYPPMKKLNIVSPYR
jgi:hypothetical protein